MPLNAGWKKPSASAEAGRQDEIAGSERCPVTSTAKKTPTTTARARSDEIISRRRG